MEKERSRLLEIMERKQKLRMGAPKESQEIIFRSVLALENEILLIEKELRDAGNKLRQVTVEWKGTEAKGPRETDAVRSHVTQKAASGSRSSKAEVGLSDVSGVVDCTGTFGPQVFDPAEEQEIGVIRKESSETHDNVSCHGMEVDDDKSLEEM